MASVIIIIILSVLLILSMIGSYLKGKKIEEIVEGLIIFYETEETKKEFRVRFGKLMNPYDYD